MTALELIWLCSKCNGTWQGALKDHDCKISQPDIHN